MTSPKKAKPAAATEKDRKPKLVRDSFTIPKNEYAAIDTLKTRALAMGLAVKKSELLRAGLMALEGLSDARLRTALAAVPTLKTGRPSTQARSASTEPVAETGKTEVAPADQAPAEAAAPVAARKGRRGKAAAAESAQ